MQSDALAARFALEQRIHATLDTLDRKLNEALALRNRLSQSDAAALNAEIANLVQLKITSSEGDLLNEAKLHDRLAFLAADVEMAYDRPTPAQYAVFDELAAQATAAEAKLSSLMGRST